MAFWTPPLSLPCLARQGGERRIGERRFVRRDEFHSGLARIGIEAQRQELGGERAEVDLAVDDRVRLVIVVEIQRFLLLGHVGFALVGPFYRANAPVLGRGQSIVSPDTAGERVRITGRVYDLTTEAPIPGATLAVWQAATNGLYENQDESQPDYNLRGQFQTDEAGTFDLVALMPTPYPVPADGPAGELLRVAHRHPYRPAHIHFIVSKPGYETLVTQVFV